MSTKNQSDHNSLRQSLFWITGALISFLTMAIAARELSDTLSPFVIVFFRTLVGFLIISACITFYGVKHISTDQISFHFLRNSIHYLGVVAWITGVGLIPLAQVFALEFSVPIWVAILAVIFLKEKMTIGKLIAITLGFIGVLIILQPGIIEIEYGSIVVLFAAFCFSIVHVCTKFLSKKDNASIILFVMFSMQLPVSIIFAYVFWTPPSWEDLPWLIFVGVTALSGHYTLTRALMLADATVILPIDFLRMPLIAILGYFLYSEPFSVYIFIGAILIFGGNYFNIYMEQRNSEKLK